jgi:teichuronic acid biosynthesis glycosyltransferase TuaC
MLRVLTLSSLFPDATRPDFGIFVERQTRALAAQPDTAVRVVAPLGLPPPPLALHSRYRTLAALPLHEQWNSLDVDRPRFLNLPATNGRFHAAMLARALRPLLARIARDFPFDVIDASFFFPDGPAAVRLGKALGVPVSIKARGADVHHWGRARATAKQVADAARRADGLLAVSQAMADDVAALGVPRDRVRVHHTGVDHARFRPGDRGALKRLLAIEGSLIVSVGALIERKGHAIVIDAVASLPGVHLRIAGNGPLRAELEARIARSGAADRIALLGAVPNDRLPQWLAAADAMALASASEGLANAWVEALASGTPIVVTAAGGAREVVDRPEAGRIVDRTPPAFAGAIADILAQPPAPQSVAAAARRFSWEANGAALRAHLAALAGR